MAVVTHDLQQRGAAEAGDVKFAVTQRLGSAVMLLQELRSWPRDQSALLGCELLTEEGLDTAGAIPREIACNVKEKVMSKRYTFVILFGTIWGSVHLPCHSSDCTKDDLSLLLKEMEETIINLRRRHHTSRVVIGSDLNVSLARCRERVTATRIHPNANRALAQLERQF